MIQNMSMENILLDWVSFTVNKLNHLCKIFSQMTNFSCMDSILLKSMSKNKVTNAIALFHYTYLSL